MTLDDLHAIAFTINNRRPDRKIPFALQAAITKSWIQERRHGPAFTREISLDDGTVGQVFACGCVAHWLGGDTVEWL